METYVKLHKFSYAALFYGFSVSPFTESDYELAELSAVIAQVVYTDGVIPEELISSVERRAYDGCRKVPYMKWFCDVYRRIIDTNRLALTLVGRTVFLTRGQDFGKHVPNERLSVYPEIEIPRIDFFYKLVRLKLAFKLFGYRHGRHTHRLGKAETGQSVISEFGIRRKSYKRSYFFLSKTFQIQFACYVFFVIHNFYAPVF